MVAQPLANNGQSPVPSMKYVQVSLCNVPTCFTSLMLVCMQCPEESTHFPQRMYVLEAYCLDLEYSLCGKLHSIAVARLVCGGGTSSVDVPECCEVERESPRRENAEREGGASSLASCQWEGYSTGLGWEGLAEEARSWSADYQEGEVNTVCNPSTITPLHCCTTALMHHCTGVSAA